MQLLLWYPMLQQFNCLYLYTRWKMHFWSYQLKRFRRPNKKKHHTRTHARTNAICTPCGIPYPLNRPIITNTLQTRARTEKEGNRQQEPRAQGACSFCCAHVLLLFIALQQNDVTSDLPHETPLPVTHTFSSRPLEKGHRWTQSQHRHVNT